MFTGYEKTSLRMGHGFDLRYDMGGFDALFRTANGRIVVSLTGHFRKGCDDQTQQLRRPIRCAACCYSGDDAAIARSPSVRASTRCWRRSKPSSRRLPTLKSLRSLSLCLAYEMRVTILCFCGPPPICATTKQTRPTISTVRAARAHN